MSVIIKGMKFPKGCDSCDLVQDYDEDSVCCPFLRSESWYGAAPDYRLEHCPLIGIPTPHGRLIDADALVNRIKNNYCNKCTTVEECGICVCQNCGVATLFDEIENSTTIIEAEVSE